MTATAVADPYDSNRNDNEAISKIRATREIVFIDPRLPDRDDLISDLAGQAEEGRHFELIVLDVNRDGIDQISEALNGGFQVDAIHFFSHGANGAIQLGGSWFNTESFEANTRKIAGWKQSLKIGADLVFYGCDFASNTEGRALVQRLAALTKADVAASSDKTGHASQGGDWDLEFSIGSIETHAALTSIARDNWKQVLAIAVDRSTWIRIPSTSPNPFTFSHETAGGGRLLLVSVASQPNQDDGIVETVTGITYGGQPLQKKGEEAQNVDNARIEIWWLVNPPLGPNDVIITFNDAFDDPVNGEGAIAGAVSFTGVHQTTPLGDFASAECCSSGSADPSVTVSSAAGELVFDTVARKFNPVTVGPDQAEQWNDCTDAGCSNVGGGASTEPGAASVTMSWTPANNRWAIGAVPIKPGLQVLMIVSDHISPDQTDLDLAAYLESNGMTVFYANDNDTDYTDDIAANNIDVVYVSASCSSSATGTEITNLNIGLVEANVGDWDEINLSNNDDEHPGTDIEIVENSHFITSFLSLGDVSVYSPSAQIGYGETLGPGAQVLARNPFDASESAIVAYDAGAQLYGGTPAPDRRVGIFTEDLFSNWTAAAQTLVLRSLLWASGTGGGGSGGSSLIAHWTFDEGSGQTAADSAGSNDGTLGTTAGVDSSDPAWACAAGGSALDFDGIDDEVSLSGVTVGNSAAWTISAWIKMGPDTADQRTIYSEGLTSATEYLFVYVDDSTSGARFYSENTAGDWAKIDGTINVEDDQWHLITVVQRSKTDRELFVDANPDGTDTRDAGTLNFDTASIGYLRTDWVADPFKGLIKDVRIYDYALSQAEITALAASPPGPCASYNITGTVYHDINASNTFDAGELGIGLGWVKLISGGSVIQVVQADPDSGAYTLTNVPDGSYTVIVDDNNLPADSTPTAPVNWQFQNPATGSLAVSVSGSDVSGQDLGLVFQFDLAADCVCGFDDGLLTQQTITINGDMSDWGAVLSDPDNNSCDATDDTDRDYPVQSTGRNLLRTAATYDGTYFAMWTQRIGSSNNTQNFIYYADTNADGIMDAGEPVIVAKWQGNTGNVTLEKYVYDDLGSGGDPLLDANGFADGYSMPGDLTFVKTLAGADGGGQGSTSGNTDGTQMEWRTTWAELGIAPGGVVSWHIASTNSNPGAAGLSAQIDDNVGGCGGQCTGSNQFGGVSPSPIDALPGSTVYLFHQIENTGNGNDAFDIDSTDTGDFAITSYAYYRDFGTVGVYEPVVDLVLTDTTGSGVRDTGTIAPAALIDIIVAAQVPAGANGAVFITTTATSNFVPGCGATVTPVSGDVVDTLLILRISGNVSEDVNADANLADATARPNATVVLYRDGGDGLPSGADDGAPIATTTTDASGNYVFNNLGAGTYWILVDSKTVSPSAGFGSGGQGDVWAEQTYGSSGARCDDGAGGTVERGSAGACYGG
ncbi:MAG: DUF4347 domain-containing protein, partial [Deltaproteobacteria bacterium]|nr:DUF4347 domain-containing protein [Deltaproteobacteria bacterium]